MGAKRTSTGATGTSRDSEQAQLDLRLSALGQQVERLFDRVPFGSHTIDAQGVFQTINSLELAWLGYSREELLRKHTLGDFLTLASQSKWLAHASSIHNPAVSSIELDMLQRNGRVMPISLVTVGLARGDDERMHRRELVFDLSESRAQQLREQLSAAVFESLSGLCITDSQQVILQVNSAFTEVTGYSAEEAIGQTPHLLSSGRHSKQFYQQMWNALKVQGRWSGEICNRRKNGELYVQWLSVSSVHDASGTVTHYIGSFLDITANKEAHEQMAPMTFHDGLTQLPNRRQLYDLLSHALTATRRNGRFGALLFVGLDNFKIVNEVSGHEAGDLVLIEAAERLRQLLRDGDSVARLGGDQFAIVLQDLDATRLQAAALAEQLGEKILLALAQPFHCFERSFQCTASIGIELYCNETTVSGLLQHADLALYQSKKAGRNTLRFFDLAMQAALTTRVALDHELRQALPRAQLRMHFQPQFDQTRHIVGAEALLRWQRDAQSLVSPAQFIGLAEETGLIVPIGQWVLQAACRQLKAWESHESARHLQLAVNVSARQFQQPDFVDSVKQAIRLSAINPALLKLEVTESMLLDVDDTTGKMQDLNDFGVRFSMDDFGTGYSSLSILTKLPLAQLKIDQSFVKNIGEKSVDQVIVETIMAMARALSIEVIAEGVETEAQRAFLHQRGCQLFQGFLFSRALPIDAFEALLH